MSMKSLKDRLDKLESKCKRKKEPPVWHINVVSTNPEESERLEVVNGQIVKQEITEP